MYADLGIGVATPFDPRKVAPLLEAAHRLGYGVVAFNETVDGMLRPSKHLCKQTLIPSSSSSSSSQAPPPARSGRVGGFNAAPAVDFVAALSAKLDDRLDKRSGRKRQREEGRGSGSASSPAAAAADATGARPQPAQPQAPPHQLSRLTVVLPRAGTPAGTGAASASSAVASAARPLNSSGNSSGGALEGVMATITGDCPVAASYDLVAVVPNDEAGLRAAIAAAHCIDIVCLDLCGGRPPVPLRPDVLSPVLAAGLALEVSYAPAIRDASARRYFIANTLALLRATRGRGVLLTSGAAMALELRSPGDAAALGSLGGLNPAAARSAMREAAAAVLLHAERRKMRAPAGGGVAVRIQPVGR